MSCMPSGCGRILFSLNHQRGKLGLFLGLLSALTAASVAGHLLPEEGDPLIGIVPDVNDEVPGREGLARGVCRALILAAAALRAGVCIKNGLPGELFYLGDAKGCGRLVLKVKWLDRACWLKEVTLIWF